MKDNVVFVCYHKKRYHVWEATMSSLMGEKDFALDKKSHIYKVFKTRGRALCYAHDMARDVISEHGVMEVSL